MEIVFLPKALEDQEYWKSIGDKRIMKRISKLLADISLLKIGKARFLQNFSQIHNRKNKRFVFQLRQAPKQTMKNYAIARR